MIPTKNRNPDKIVVVMHLSYNIHLTDSIKPAQSLALKCNHWNCNAISVKNYKICLDEKNNKKINLVLLISDIHCLCKQCRSRSVGF